MFLGKEVIGNPIINLQDGLHIGRLQDLYLDQQLQKVVGLYVGSEGLLNPTLKWIDAANVSVISRDTILVRDDSIVTGELDERAHSWIRRDDLQGRPVDTIGGTKIGRIDDVILNEQAEIAGFSLGRIYVFGPVAERRALRRTAVNDVGHEDGSMTINLDEVEQQDLRVVDKAFFGEEVRLDTEADQKEEAEGASPAPEEDHAAHVDESPYVADAEKEKEK